MTFENDDMLVRWQEGRSVPQVGDFFAIRTGRGLELLGRVASVNARMLSASGSMKVIYLYSPGTPSKPPPSFLPISAIWIGPMIVLPSCWGQTYFKRVGHRPFLPGEMLRSHRFWAGRPDEIRDEHGELALGELPERLGLPYVNPPFGVAEAIKFRLAGEPDLHEPPT